MYQLSDSLRGDSSLVARLLAVLRSRVAGALGVAAVLAVVALPDPLPAYPPGTYALVGVVFLLHAAAYTGETASPWAELWLVAGLGSLSTAALLRRRRMAAGRS
jgi:hypothetical protein